MRRAMIIGSAGQDGTLLFERLRRDGCELLGIGHTGTVHHPAVGPAFDEAIDILDRVAVAKVTQRFAPDAIFYLAAHHHSAEDLHAVDDADLYLRSHDIHVRGLLNVLEAVESDHADTRVFYAASSHCFGDAPTRMQDEDTPLRPHSPYGITKATGVQLCRMYRASHGVRASAGFLYNHESPLRRSNFLSMKIVRGVVDISRGLRGKLILGDLSARVDWGYAPDYVDAMIRIVGLDGADDFIISTGEPHSVQEFVTIAFSQLDLDWHQYVDVQSLVVVKRLTELVGDNAKLRKATGWSPTVGFEEMIRILVDAELHRTRDQV
jgi:GDPmannose 4,6-dehydratase